MKMQIRPSNSSTEFEGALVEVSGDFLSGTLRFRFQGAFPLDPLPYMTARPPDPPPGGGFWMYEIKPPAQSLDIATDSNAYSCSLEEVFSTGYTLRPYTGFNLRGIQRAKVPTP